MKVLTWPILHICKKGRSITNVATLSVKREFIQVDRMGQHKNVGLIRLNRTNALNALCEGLMDDINFALDEFDKNKAVGAMIITGNGRAFAAGADLKEMESLDFSKAFNRPFPLNWPNVSKLRKPVIACVNGYALGGGFELAMLCDIVYASQKAIFGAPEILRGTIPAGGATQRLSRIVGKSKAMEICLTGNHFSAIEAEKIGLVSKVFPPEELLPQTIKLGEKIASLSPMAIANCKEAINKSQDMTLSEALNFEKRLYQATFFNKKETTMV